MPLNSFMPPSLSVNPSSYQEQAWQWQPTLRQHEDVNPPITLEDPVSSVPMRSTLRVWTLRR
jgi:hypothetical protein